MAALKISRLSKTATLIRPWFVMNRPISLSSSLHLRKVNVTHDDAKNITYVEGVNLDVGNKALLEVSTDKDLCPLCPMKLGVRVEYTDVLIVSQFVREDGEVLTRDVTGLCDKAHYRLKQMVHKAQRAGLMPELRPGLEDGRERTSLKSKYKWKKYNVYFTDTYRKLMD